MLPGFAGSGGVGLAATWQAAIGLTHLHNRALHVLAWGRNVEGQCGVEASVMVLRPTAVLELHDSQLTALHAGKLTSGATSRGGEAYTWGDGKGGKLGHGSAETVQAPYRVESLVGRAEVVGLALGDHHSLFVDAAGSVWSCGENKEGQCGLGTPLEVIASQHRRTYHEALRQEQHHHNHHHVDEQPRSREARVKHAISALLGGLGRPAVQHQAAAGGGGTAVLMQEACARSPALWHGTPGLAVSPGASVRGARMALGFSGFDAEGAFAASGLQPGQQTTPLRIGRDQHPLLMMDAAPGVGASHGGSGGPAAWLTNTPTANHHNHYNHHNHNHHSGGRQPQHKQLLPQQPDVQLVPPEYNEAAGSLRTVLPSGLESCVVLSVAAGRHMSAAVTDAGEVWTWGACYNGSLGNSSSWSTAAQKVCGPLAAAIEDGGGAVQVVTGGTFCAALTAAGRVVVWGKLPAGPADGGGPEGGGGGQMIGLTEQGVSVVQGSRLVAGQVAGLPPITHIAAGQQHVIMSDGQRVWLVGRMLGASGLALPDMCAPWWRPLEVVLEGRAPGDGVAQLAAGVHSAGVVSERGELWMWGRLLDRHHGESLFRRFPRGCFSPGPLLSDDVEWGWSGFGADRPLRVEGLSGPVRALALGGWHALAAVE